MPECKNGELELVGAGFGGPKGRKIERCEVLRSHSGDPTGEAAVVCGASGDFFCEECGWVCELCARSCSASGHQLTEFGELENRGQGSGTEADIAFKKQLSDGREHTGQEERSARGIFVEQFPAETLARDAEHASEEPGGSGAQIAVLESAEAGGRR